MAISTDEKSRDAAAAQVLGTMIIWSKNLGYEDFFNMRTGKYAKIPMPPVADLLARLDAIEAKYTAASEPVPTGLDHPVQSALEYARAQA